MGDLSCERVPHDGSGGVKTEGVIVQAKHWRRQVLIVATRGRFTADAIGLVEQRTG